MMKQIVATRNQKSKSEIKKITKEQFYQNWYQYTAARGIISSTAIIRKLIYRDVCDSKISGNETLPGWAVKK